MNAMMGAMGAGMLILVVGLIALAFMVAAGVGLLQRQAAPVASGKLTDGYGNAPPSTGSESVNDPSTADEMRASDADREYTVAVLQSNTTAGRLTTGEFADRATAVYSSLTIGELRALITDLPRGG